MHRVSGGNVAIVSCGDVDGPVFELFVGNLLPAYVADAVECVDGTSGPADWQGWGLVFQLRGPVTITGIAAGDSDGVLTHDWVAGETDTPGEYEVLFVGTSPDGKPRTFKARGLVRISVP